jgi:hypothetical protein
MRHDAWRNHEYTGPENKHWHEMQVDPWERLIVGPYNKYKILSPSFDSALSPFHPREFSLLYNLLSRPKSYPVHACQRIESITMRIATVTSLVALAVSAAGTAQGMS